MLQMTKQTFTSQDAQAFGGAGNVSKPNFASNQATQMGMTGAEPGIDISKLDFVGKAKTVFDASIKKDKQKAGIL